MAEFEPRIIVFACNWCTYAAADIAGTNRIQYPPNVRIIRVMCSGMVAPEHISLALESGADGVLVAGCHPGDCHYISGNLKAEERVQMVSKVTNMLGIEEERVRLKWIATSEGTIFAQTIRDMVEELKKLGPSPFRESRQVSQEKPALDLEDILQETKAYYCLECSKCTSICPVAKYDSSCSPRSVIEDVALGLERESTRDKKLFSCLGCYACSLRCPTDVDFPAFVQRVRALAFGADEHGCPAHGGFLHSVTRLMARSPYKQKRLGWLTKEYRVSDNSDILYFVGCAPYFDPVFQYLELRTLDITEASLKILNHLGVEPMLLPDEKCCGHDALWTGDTETFQRLAEHNTRVIREAGIKKIIFSCPEGYRTFKLDYPKYGFKLDCELQHISEFVAGKMGEQELKLKEFRKKVTYQDPCRLGRHLGIYDSPRQLLQAIPGIELAEMEKNREYALCCGTSAFTNCDLYSHEMRVGRLQEAKATGAEILVTDCPKCQIHFRCAMNNKGEEKGPDINIEVMDLAKLVADALE
ncbi:MAG: hydrogenase iron-sulfur subunit [Dehalococcoidia bacterium]|nr:hydrogenase iron-sulfur subunit [Dehalococcoidia bacterium]